MFQFEPLYLLPLQDSLVNLVGLVVLALLLTVLVEITCLFCGLISDLPLAFRHDSRRR
jgi:hypothetical protein